MKDTLHKSLLDEEWVELMIEARNLGFTVEDVELFLVEHANRGVC